MNISDTIATEDDLFKLVADRMAERIHDIAVRHGWWEGEQNDAGNIALMHSELSEALEGMRRGNPPDDHCPQFDTVTVELADCIIRILDYAKARNLPIAEAIVAKCRHNETRPYRHGKKF